MQILTTREYYIFCDTSQDYVLPINMNKSLDKVVSAVHNNECEKKDTV